jgi:hypothetical protein
MPEEEGLNTTLGFAHGNLGQDDPESGGRRPFALLAGASR